MDMTVVAVEDKTVVAIETPQPFLVSAGAQGPAGPALGTGTGLLAKTGAASYAARAIVAGVGILVTSGDGVAANPSVAVDTSVVVTTGGSYADPGWITSLAWSKLTGTPTTVAGYGISDVYTKTVADARYAPIAVPWASITGTPTTVAGYGISDVYTKTAGDARYAAIATTLTGYGITDAYTKTASDALYSPIAGSASLVTVGTIGAGVWNAGAVTSSGAVQAASASTLGISTDVLLNRDGANILALRNGASAQTFCVYSTFTNASNYALGSLSASSTNITLAALSSGTGSANVGLKFLPIGTGNVSIVSANNSGNPILTIQANNLTAGLAFTYQGVGVTGSNAAIDLSLKAKGTGGYVWLGQDSDNSGIRFSPTNANTIWFGACTVLIAADTGQRISIGLTSTPATGISVMTATGALLVCSTTDDGSNKLQVTGGIKGTGLITSSGATSGIGYATGAGGTVTQLTNKSTGVTLSKVCGQITMNNAALAAGAIVSFVLTNTAIAATDVVELQHQATGTGGAYGLNAQSAAGSATINVRNNTAGSLSEAIVISFVVIKGVTA